MVFKVISRKVVVQFRPFLFLRPSWFNPFLAFSVPSLKMAETKTEYDITADVSPRDVEASQLKSLLAAHKH
jgi:hypothetical protein